MDTLPTPRVALMQPSFLPWQGYFALIASADVFVFLDDFQFQRHSFHQRNRVRLADGSELWITVPVGRSGDAEFPSLDTARPIVDPKWARRLKATLDQSYGRAEYHDVVRPGVEKWIDTTWPSLAAMNVAFIRMVADLLEFTPEWALSSECGATGERSERVVALLRHLGARTYLCARGAFEYMAEDGVFPVPDVQVGFQHFEPQPYPQRRTADFVSHLSILDALFEVGPAATRDLVLAGQCSWDDWDAMARTASAIRVGP
jgi:hypothetical protein